MEDREVMEIWSEIKKFVELNPGIYTTRWKNGREGVRFRAENIRGDIHISVQDHKGGSSSGSERDTAPDYRCIGRLKNEDFPALYSLYLRREKGEAVSREAGKVNRRPIYFWGLIYWAYEKKKKPQL